ncbi:MAG: polysaccharide deacetylase family protein [Pirellulales bacterium]
MRTFAITMGALLTLSAAGLQAVAADVTRDSYGGIVRGDVNAKRLALVFTGDEKGESTEPILDTLKQRGIHGSFCVTGNFIERPALRKLIERAIAEGHYVGPHSNRHPLYASWEERKKSLVTQAEFAADLNANIAGLKALGALRDAKTVHFIPPYEQFNRDQVEWSRPLGVTLFNFTPGSGSNRDYAPEGDAHFVPSQRIYDDILTYEGRDPHGLNGFILLLHLGSGRKDPFHPRLGTLCGELAKRGYEFVRVDELLGSTGANARHE